MYPSGQCENRCRQSVPAKCTDVLKMDGQQALLHHTLLDLKQAKIYLFCLGRTHTTRGLLDETDSSTASRDEQAGPLRAFDDP